MATCIRLVVERNQHEYQDFQLCQKAGESVTGKDTTKPEEKEEEENDIP